MSVAPRCRACRAPLDLTLVDLGTMPLANAYVRPGAPIPDPAQPLRVLVCQSCFLVQADHDIDPAVIFSQYAYYSSFAASWLRHAAEFARTAIERAALGSDTLVLEVASNDGYLLRHFVEAGVPVLGVEPAENVAKTAREAGIPTRVEFFGREVAQEIVRTEGPPALIVANNVLAHVPDINDFVAGFAAALAAEGVASVEFPHLLRLLEEVQFDTIYHEHYSYLSLLAVEGVLRRHGLRAFEVEQLPTHGGSLRVWICHERSVRDEDPSVGAVRALEADAGLGNSRAYHGFAEEVRLVQKGLRRFLAQARAEGRRVVGYGAAAKGNTLINSCGLTVADLAFIVDRSPHKQGLLTPGSRIPIVDPEEVFRQRPDYLVILAWNLRDEIMEQMSAIREWGGRFVVAIPRLEVLP